MAFQIGDILSVPLFAHTRHFFVYIGNGETIGWRPWDGMSWTGSKGHIERKALVKAGSEYKWLNNNGELQNITLEERTGVSQQLIIERINQMTTGIDYHLGHLQDNYYSYHLSHSLGGQHLYVTSIPKSKNFELSYNSIVLAYFGAFFGRGEILGIVRQLRGC